MKLRERGHWKAVGAVAVLVCVIGGCATRSISDSGYRREGGGRTATSDNPFYKGELSELQVIGINPESKVTQEDVERAMASRQRVIVPKGSSIMLIQSGAMIPDEPMVKAMEKYFSVSVFSGAPATGSSTDYAMLLRLAAAKGGHEKIVAFWGILESAQKGIGTKVVSWVPLVGGVIPDETQEMRIRLKVAVVDVKTGSWDMFSPEPFEDSAASARYTREASDQGLVSVLKAKAYQAAAETLVNRYSK